MPSDFFADQLMENKEHLNPMQLAYQAQALSAQLGFDFSHINETLHKIKEELDELEQAFEERETTPEHFVHEVGDCFFALINLCRHAGIDPEKALQASVHKYLKRCQYIEKKLQETGKTWQQSSLAELDILWEEAKKV